MGLHVPPGWRWLVKLFLWSIPVWAAVFGWYLVAALMK